MHAPRSRRSIAAACLAALLATLLPAAASAGGFFILPHGVRGLGRGGAAVVGVHDLNALWYNPALLAGVDGSLLMVDATLVSQSVFFQRAPRTLDNGEVVTFAAVENEAAPLPVPQLGFTSDFGIDGLQVALGAFAPNGAASKYPVKGPQRYTIVDSEGSLFVTVELAAAWRLTDWLWLGAGFQNMFVSLRLVSTVSAWPGPVGDAEDADFDVLLQTDVASLFTPTGNLGVFVEPLKGLQLGLSAQLPAHIQDDAAKVKQRLPDHVLFDGAKVKGDTVAAEFDFPLILRAGVRYAAPRWDIEADVVHERWSTLDAIRTTPQDVEIQDVPGVGAIPVGALNIPRGFQDTWSLRLGGDVIVLPERLTLRAGVALEQSAIPTKTLSVLQIDTDKLALGIGASIDITDGLAIDLAYGHVFYTATDVTDSEIRQLNPTNAEGTVIVGNGRYEASANLIGLGVRWGF